MIAAGREGGVRVRFAVSMIALTAFFIRALHVFSYFRFPTSDETHYYDAALNRLALSRLFTPQGFTFFPAGYPMFLRPFFLLFEGDAALRAAQIGQAALGAWTCVLLYRLGRRIHSRLAGLAAAVACCFFPHFLFFSSAYMSEGLFIPLYLQALLCLMHARGRRSRSLYIAGILCGAGALVRPVVASLAPAVIPACRRDRTTLKGSSASLALFVAGLATIVGPWALRNWIAYGHFVLIAPNDGFNLFIGNHPEAVGRFNMPESEELDPWLARRTQYGEAWDFAKEDPVGLLFIVGARKWHAFWEFLQPWPLSTSDAQLFVGEGFFPVVSWRMVLAAGLLGAGMLLAAGRARWWITPACFASYVAFYMIFFGNSRFRLPSEAFFVLWTGVAVAVLLRMVPAFAKVHRSRWALATCLLLVAVLAQSGLDAAMTRAVRSEPASLLASGEGFRVDTGAGPQTLFGERPIPVDRSRARYLRLDVSLRRGGAGRHPSNLAQIRFTFLDASGKPVYFAEKVALYIETLRRRRWEWEHMKAQIPPGAAACRVTLDPSYEFQEELRVGRSALRYSRGNDLALEFLFPYLRWGE